MLLNIHTELLKWLVTLHTQRCNSITSYQTCSVKRLNRFIQMSYYYNTERYKILRSLVNQLNIRSCRIKFGKKPNRFDYMSFEPYFCTTSYGDCQNLYYEYCSRILLITAISLTRIWHLVTLSYPPSSHQQLCRSARVQVNQTDMEEIHALPHSRNTPISH